MFSVIHKKVTVKFFSIFLIFIFIIGLLPQQNVTADSVNQVDSPPAKFEILEGNQIDLVSNNGKLVTHALHVKSPQSGAFFVWEVADPPANGAIDIAEANTKASISYLPTVGFSGMDRFAIRVNDTQGNTELIIFHILVENEAELGNAKEPPIPAQHSEPQLDQLNSEKAVIPMQVQQQPLEPVKDHRTLRIAQGESVTLQMDAESVKRITLDAIGADPRGLTWRVTQMPAQGEVFLNPSGTSVEVIYKPDDGFRDIETLTLAVIDSYGNQAETRLLFVKEKTGPVLESMPSNDVHDQSQYLSEDGGSAQSETYFPSINETYPLGEDADVQPGGVPALEPSGLQQQLLATPYIDVYPQEDYLSFYNLTPDTEVTLMIGSDVWTTTSDSGGYGYFWLAYIFDIQAEQTLVVSDQLISRTHTVIDLRMTDFDLASNSISGVANAGVLIVSRKDAWEDVETPANSEGLWTASFTSDLVAGSYGTLVQADDDGDRTLTSWSIPNPMLTIDKSNGVLVRATGWPAELPKTIFIDDVQVAVNDENSTSFNYYPGVSLPVGTKIKVECGTYSKEHTVIDLRMTGFDLAGNSILGVADPGVLIVSRGDAWEDVETVANSEGLWSVIFTSDLVAVSNGYLSQADGDGDSTLTSWSIPNPMLTIDKYYGNEISGTGWPTELAKTIYVNDVSVAVINDGLAYFDYESTVPLPADTVVRVECGTYIKEHTIIDLSMTSYDLPSSSISGVANEGELIVKRWDDWEELTATANGSGLWSQVFSNTLVKGAYGALSQSDSDGDSTYVRWEILDPHVEVNIKRNNISSWGWKPGETVTISLNGMVQATVTASEWGWASSNIPVDIVGEDTVLISNGTESVTHVVKDISFTWYDEDSDTIWGKAEPGEIRIDAHDTGGWDQQTIQVGDDRLWTADFSGMTNIGPGTQVDLRQYDNNSNSTFISWYIDAISMTVYLQNNDILTQGWPDNTEVTLSINGTEVETRTINASSWFYPEQTLLPDDEVIISSSLLTLTHVIRNISVTSWDFKAETVSGKAAANTEVTLAVTNGSNWWYQDAVANSSGDWTAYFAGVVDIAPGIDGWVIQYDKEGNSTHSPFQIRNPYFYVDYQSNEVLGYEWSVNSTITVTIDGQPSTTQSNSNGYFSINLSPFDILPGDEIQVTDGIDNRTHVVKNLSITSIDVEGNILTGTADPGELRVRVCLSGNCYSKYPVADGEGVWTEDFTDTTDITIDSYVYLYQYDDQGNYTWLYWYIPNPYFYVYLSNNEVAGYEWSPNSTITVTIGGQYWTTQSDSYGEFKLYISNFSLYQIIPGDEVQVSDGTSTRTHIVKDLSVTDIDVDANTLTGTADPGELEVMTCTSGYCYDKYPVANGEGIWAADFTGTTDITLNSYGWIYQYDAQGNYTEIYWFVPNPYFYVYPLTNIIYGNEWAPNATITISTTGQSWTDRSDSGGWFSLATDSFDILPEQTITVSDGHSTRTHKVKNLSVTNIDLDADILTGTADPGELRVRTCSSAGCYYKYPVADGEGIWMEDYTGITDITIDSYGYLYQYDDQGNYTVIYWYQPDPIIRANLSSDLIFGDRWPAFVEVSINVNGTNLGTKTSDSYGGFYIFLNEFDLEVGQEILITSPEYDTVTYTTQTIAFGGYDITEDTVWGTAENGIVYAEACVEDFGYYDCSLLEINVNNGTWLADFTGVVDLVPGSGGSAFIEDENFNRTEVNWHIPNPRFSVNLPANVVSGNEWPIGSAINVNISGVAEAFQTVANEYGQWGILIEGTTIVPSMIITVTGTIPNSVSTIQREHLVRTISVTKMDFGLDTVEGTADAEVLLEVLIIDETQHYGYIDQVFSDLNGNWIADFSSMIDIVPGFSVQVATGDDDGDYTVLDWQPGPFLIYLPQIRK